VTHQRVLKMVQVSTLFISAMGLEQCWGLGFRYKVEAPLPVSVEAKLSFVEPGRRWVHSQSPSKAPGISYQGTTKTSVRMLKTSGGL